MQQKPNYDHPENPGNINAEIKSYKSVEELEMFCKMELKNLVKAYFGTTDNLFQCFYTDPDGKKTYIDVDKLFEEIKEEYKKN